MDWEVRIFDYMNIWLLKHIQNVQVDCCRHIFLATSNQSSDFYHGYSSFLGQWMQVKINIICVSIIFQDKRLFYTLSSKVIWCFPPNLTSKHCFGFSWYIPLHTSKNAVKSSFVIFKTDEVVNEKPYYMRVGNPRLSLGFSNAKNYPTPWTMWGLCSQNKGSHIGNVKIGPEGVKCPEFSTVSSTLKHSLALCWFWLQTILLFYVQVCGAFNKIMKSFLYLFSEIFLHGPFQLLQSFKGERWIPQNYLC